MQRTAPPTAITLRNLPPGIAEAIRERAEQDKTSFNKTVIRILEESLGAQLNGGRRTNGLERFAGTWTDEQADEFDAQLKEIRKIDPELWD